MGGGGALVQISAVFPHWLSHRGSTWGPSQVRLVTEARGSSVDGCLTVRTGRQVLLFTRPTWAWFGQHALEGGWPVGALILRPGGDPSMNGAQWACYHRQHAHPYHAGILQVWTSDQLSGHGPDNELSTSKRRIAGHPNNQAHRPSRIRPTRALRRSLFHVRCNLATRARTWSLRRRQSLWRRRAPVPPQSNHKRRARRPLRKPCGDGSWRTFNTRRHAICRVFRPWSRVLVLLRATGGALVAFFECV